MSQSSTGDTSAGRSYAGVLTDAVRVLTETARLTRPVLEPAPPGQSHGVVVEAFAPTVGQDGSESAREVQEARVYVESGRREPVDFAEFVAQALVAVAANVGGVETVLAGRAGSWEADAVRQLLVGTVGGDEEYLVAHRTDPVVVEVFVEEILNDLDVWSNWDDAARAIARRAGQVPLDAEDQEQRLDAIAAEEEQFEQAREQAWANYGQALRQQIETAAAGRTELRVPVQVVVDLERAPATETTTPPAGTTCSSEPRTRSTPPASRRTVGLLMGRVWPWVSGLGAQPGSVTGVAGPRG